MVRQRGGMSRVGGWSPTSHPAHADAYRAEQCAVVVCWERRRLGGADHHPLGHADAHGSWFQNRSGTLVHVVPRQMRHIQNEMRNVP